MTQTRGHFCCWHSYSGPIHIVLQSGQVVETCCKCSAMRIRHAGHSSSNWIGEDSCSSACCKTLRLSLRKIVSSTQEGL
jgi:hypothetical protein